MLGRLSGVIRVAALVAMALAGLTAQTWAEGLVRSFDSPHIFWVDRFGIRHHVNDTAVLRDIFGDQKAAQISVGELVNIPLGQDVNFAQPPQFYDSHRDRTAYLEGQVVRRRTHRRWRAEEDAPRYNTYRNEAPTSTGYYDRERFERETRY